MHRQPKLSSTSGNKSRQRLSIRCNNFATTIDISSITYYLHFFFVFLHFQNFTFTNPSSAFFLLSLLVLHSLFSIPLLAPTPFLSIHLYIANFQCKIGATCYFTLFSPACFFYLHLSLTKRNKCLLLS